MLKKMMEFRKKNIFTLLFSIYFLLYLLSPFCLAEEGLSENSLISYRATLTVKNIRVIWEMILSNFINRDVDESSRANVQVLIKKARALISSNGIVKPVPSESAEFDYNDIIFSPGYHSSLDLLGRFAYQTGSYLLLSGLSPPAPLWF